MSEQRLENRTFAVMWLVAIAVAIAAGLIRGTLGDAAYLIPTVCGAVFGVGVAAFLEIRKRSLIASRRPVLAHKPHCQSLLERQQAGTRGTFIGSRLVQPTNSYGWIVIGSLKTVGMANQPHAAGITWRESALAGRL